MPGSPARPLLAALALLLLSVAALVGQSLAETRSAAGATVSDHPVIQRAYQDLGTWQGQCWPWVRRVVADATGRTMGFDYRLGFFEAGAWEVGAADALPGDVIQLADDADTHPAADYPGLHTAIIVSVDAPGVFTVIDANSQWDGIVRVRSGYDPAASASRYPWISYHIYRFPLPGDDYAPPPFPELVPLPDGERATVATPGDCLNLRNAPSTGAAVIGCLPDGTEVVLLGPIRSADGYEWVEVATRWGTGWVASPFLARDTGTASGVPAERRALPYRSVLTQLATD